MEPTALEALQAVIDRLTAADGCPWDKEQTPQSLADYIIEESHELVSAIRSGNVADIREELGDVAFCYCSWPGYTNARASSAWTTP